MNESKRPDSIGREVLFEVDDRVAHVRLARPESRNAINGSVVRALAWIVDQVEADRGIAVAVLSSATPGMFCAGADLSEYSAQRGPEGSALTASTPTKATSNPRGTPERPLFPPCLPSPMRCIIKASRSAAMRY